MGLLNRASGASERQGLLVRAKGARRPSAAFARQEASLAETLVDRILRLAVHDTTPYTALSLLKAYISFKEGLCLRRSGASYTCYAAIGLDSELLCLPAEGLSLGDFKSPTRLKAADAGLSCMVSDSDLWLFPLDLEGAALLILTENPRLPLEANELLPVLTAIKPKLLPPAEPEKTDTLEYFLNSSFSALPSGSASVLVMSGDRIEETAETLQTLLSSSGAARRLGSDKLLLIFPARLDAELIGHRLRKSLGLTVVSTFPVEGTEEAVRLLAHFA